jgi:hypothetical protein
MHEGNIFDGFIAGPIFRWVGQQVRWLFYTKLLGWDIKYQYFDSYKGKANRFNGRNFFYNTVVGILVLLVALAICMMIS